MVAVIGDAVRLRLRVGVIFEQENVIVVEAAVIVENVGLNRTFLTSARPSSPSFSTSKATMPPRML